MQQVKDHSTIIIVFTVSSKTLNMLLCITDKLQCALSLADYCQCARHVNMYTVFYTRLSM